MLGRTIIAVGRAFNKLRPILLCAIAMCWCVSSDAEVLAKAKSKMWSLSVVSTGDPWKNGCELILVGQSSQTRQEISIKQSKDNCAIFGTTRLHVTDTTKHKTNYVYFEAARGGDGDHSGPIVEVFELSNHGFHKLGEQQLYEVNYHRVGEETTFVTGNMLFSFCYTCDGPEGAPEDNIYVPSKLTLGCGGICVRPMVGKRDREKLLNRFIQRKEETKDDYNKDKDYREYVDSTEKDIREFLSR